jgi:replicative DNA helicase
VCKNKALNNGVTGIDTGFMDINRMTGGLQRQDFIIMAARPSMGKTTLSLNLASNISKKDVVAIFSLEMSKEQLGKKIVSSKANVDLLKINTGQLDTKDWENIGMASGPLAQSKLFIDDTAAISVAEIKAKCKKIKLQHGLDLVIIDYLQLIGSTEKSQSREQEISKISRSLKQLAKELDVTVIALSQLSRACEARKDHRPILSDLRESGGIEQDADIVVFLYRDEYYNKETEDKNVAEAIFAKNRNGKVGTVRLAWLGQYQKFGNLDGIHEEGNYDPKIFTKEEKWKKKVEEAPKESSRGWEYQQPKLV